MNTPAGAFSSTPRNSSAGTYRFAMATSAEEPYTIRCDRNVSDPPAYARVGRTKLPFAPHAIVQPDKRARARVPTGSRCLLNLMLILNAYPDPNSGVSGSCNPPLHRKCLLHTKVLAEALRDAEIDLAGAITHGNRDVEHLSNDGAHLSNGGSASATAK